MTSTPTPDPSASPVAGLLSSEQADCLLTQRQLRDYHAILKRHPDYSTVVLSQAGIGLLAHGNALAAMHALFIEQATSGLRGLLTDPDSLDDLFDNRSTERKRQNARVHALATRLGLSLAPPVAQQQEGGEG